MTQQLPTEPGRYSIPGDDGWSYAALTLLPDGRWFRHGDLLSPEAVRAYLPLTRLVPLSVEDRTLIWSALIGTLVAEDVDPEAVDDLRALAARISPDQNGHNA